MNNKSLLAVIVILLIGIFAVLGISGTDNGLPLLSDLGMDGGDATASSTDGLVQNN